MRRDAEKGKERSPSPKSCAMDAVYVNATAQVQQRNGCQQCDRLPCGASGQGEHQWTE